MTSVVNVHVKFIRPKYNNLKEWMADPNNVYIGRKGVVFVDGKRFPLTDSVWANPFKITRDMSSDQTVDVYEKWIRDYLKMYPQMLEALKTLRGKTLGCWCKPERCHGDVLASIIDED